MSDTSSSLLSSFVNEQAIKLWQDCCIAATECCERMVKERNNKLTTRGPELSNDELSEGPSRLCSTNEGA